MNTLKISRILRLRNFLIPECFAVQLSNMVQSVQQGKDTYYLLLGHDDRSLGEAPTNSSGCIFLIIELHPNCKLSSYKHLDDGNVLCNPQSKKFALAACRY